MSACRRVCRARRTSCGATLPGFLESLDRQTLGHPPVRAAGDVHHVLEAIHVQSLKRDERTRPGFADKVDGSGEVEAAERGARQAFERDVHSAGDMAPCELCRRSDVHELHVTVLLESMEGTGVYGEHGDGSKERGDDEDAPDSARNDTLPSVTQVPDDVASPDNPVSAWLSPSTPLFQVFHAPTPRPPDACLSRVAQ